MDRDEENSKCRASTRDIFVSNNDNRFSIQQFLASTRTWHIESYQNFVASRSSEATLSIKLKQTQLQIKNYGLIGPKDKRPRALHKGVSCVP
ncbi:MAG TPA: hypothetical protein DGH68_01580 [Bacteroidetes bacterium]|nr:hypothetical protein [Bacteroidota bacterium]